MNFVRVFCVSTRMKCSNETDYSQYCADKFSFCMMEIYEFIEYILT